MPSPVGHRHPWSAVDDAQLKTLLDAGEPVRAVARQLDRSADSIYWRAKLLRIPIQSRRRAWTPEEVSRLDELTGLGYEYSRIAVELRRTAHAVGQKASEEGITRKETFYSARRVARVIGVNDRTVATWLRQRWLIPRRQGRRLKAGGSWQILWEDLTAFLADPRFARAYRPQRIRDSALREWALEAHARHRAAGLRLLTTAEAAAVLSYSYITLRHWVRRGILAPVLKGERGTYYFYEKDVVAFEPPEPPAWHVPDTAAFRRRWLAGEPYSYLARSYGVSISVIRREVARLGLPLRGKGFGRHDWAARAVSGYARAG